MNDKIQGVVAVRKNQEARQRAEAEQAKLYARIAQGVLAGICFIVMIIGFSVGNLGLGIGFLILALGFGICCAAYENLTEQNAKRWIIIPVIIIAFILLLTLS